ncbi:choice-of-anchor Q domain-containing protein [Dokdonella soli]|uniref:Right-handed parallel beta-helix repeat-containing protein n=1 Tax=Dokdonella soli TaxID=529810 RepID=A0ABN1IXV5_9GAMM
MTSTRFVPSIARRRKPLAACFAALFALAAQEAIAANTWTVTTCADSGPGSLRAVIATPATLSGDTVDLSTLSCSTISLTTGAITIAQNELNIQGPSRHEVITGYYSGTRSTENDRIFNHTGTGTLKLQYLDVEYSNLSPGSGNAKGGCIYSKGNVYLMHALVLSCQAKASGSNQATGGGIYAKGNLTAKYSQIVANSAIANGGSGGGAYVGGAFTAIKSTINGNSATNHGGISAHKGASILNSTLSGNTAFQVGGLFVDGGNTDSLLISDSTISGNAAQGNTSSLVGGIRSTISTTVQNSTIAFNTAVVGRGDFSTPYAPGLAMAPGAASSTPVNLQSSILSNNTYGTTEVDFSTAGTGFTITSANSLIRASLGSQLPATVTTACPLLGPLRDNGGPTPTHALMSRSPAIDAGNNAAGLTGDQRGTAYPRVSGPAADIGAYEVQQNDVIFNNGFDGCP